MSQAAVRRWRRHCAPSTCALGERTSQLGARRLYDRQGVRADDIAS